MLAAIQLKRQTLPVDAKFARARSAWYETCQLQNRLSLASCVLLPIYSNMLKLACTVVADHLRFHIVGARMPVEVSTALSQQTCDADDTPTKRCWLGIPPRLEGSVVVVSGVRISLSAEKKCTPISTARVPDHTTSVTRLYSIPKDAYCHSI
eukprot:1269055-Amphidinium_carterae.1